MAVSANKQLTMVFNSSDDQVNVVDNQQETSAGRVTLPGPTESLAISSDATIGFAAVPSTAVSGMAPGSVEIVNLSTFALEAPVPNCASAAVNCLSGARFIVLSPDNSHLLVFGNGANSMAVVSLNNSGTTSTPNWTVESVNQLTSNQLDHPVWAVFSQDGSTAFIMNCGPECGGTAASVSALKLSDNSLTAVAVPGGATYGAAFGSTLYVAGTNASTPCPAGTSATNCGTLTVIETAGGGLHVLKSVPITNGYHSRMAVTSDNQVFIGALGCTNVFSSTEQRGCLSIYNANNGKVVIGTDAGDVTSIQPVTGRNNVYVIEDGELRNWSTLTDALAPSQNQLEVLGEAVDVKLVD